MVEKTKYWTIMVSSGLRKLQNTPSTERLSFVLKSRDTSWRMRKRYFLMAWAALSR